MGVCGSGGMPGRCWWEGIIYLCKLSAVDKREYL